MQCNAREIQSLSAAAKTERDSSHENRKGAIKLPKGSLNAVLHCARHVLEGLNTPKALAVSICLRYDDTKALASLDIDPYDYTEAMYDKFRRDYQAVALLKKSEFLTSASDKEQSALDKWCEAERRCAVTNDRLRHLWYTDPGSNPTLHAKLLKARVFIERLLGKAPQWCDLDFRFGPGATALHKRMITRPKKYCRTICCTPELLPALLSGSLTGFHWNPNQVLCIDGNTLSFVPKTFKIDRAIAVEPDLNGYAQLGIGNAIRGRLRKHLDLDTQAEVNSSFAECAYSEGFATIDLSSASDTVSEALVNILLPEDWLELLDACRCRFTTYKSKRIMLEKYSSMGNGFTFELETLIFYALAVVSGFPPATTTVFGDDIIVESSDRNRLEGFITLLNDCGFVVNLEKTFLDGLFFESCGSDYFCGKAVRPIFWKRLEEVSDLYNIANSISELAVSLFYGEKQATIEDRYRDAALRRPFDILCRFLSDHKVLYYAPVGWEGIGVYASFDAVAPKPIGVGLCGFVFKATKFCSDTYSYVRSTTGYLASLDQKRSIRFLLDIADPIDYERYPVRDEGCIKEHTYEHFGVWSGTGGWI